MKKLLFVIFCMLLGGGLIAQNGFKWQHAYGGTGDEGAFDLILTSDGGYVFAGFTNSNDGDVSGNHGEADFWVVKIDSDSNIEWQQCYGGVANDTALKILQTNDLGYIVAGTSNSNEGDVSGNHGGYDYWVIKINQTGQLLWQKCFGGSGDEFVREIDNTDDDGFVISGFSNSIDGDVDGNHGDNDIWVIKLDEDGDLLWNKCYGGTNNDFGGIVQQTTDGGYMIVGSKLSDAVECDGTIWVVKTDANGEILWDYCYGGVAYVMGPYLINSGKQTLDGGYIFAGFKPRSGGPGSRPFAYYLKLDSTGVQEWDIAYQIDFSYNCGRCVNLASDSGFVFAAWTTYNITGDSKDFRLFTTDKDGNQISAYSYGGFEIDIPYLIRQTPSNELIVAGITKSYSYRYNNVWYPIEIHGGSDAWIVNHCRPDALTVAISDEDYCISTTLTASDGFESYLWSTGEITQSIEVTAGGNYSVSAVNASGCPTYFTLTVPEPILPGEGPPISISISDESYCLSTYLTASDGFASYVWSTGESGQTIEVFHGGVYSVIGTSSEGCTSNAQITAPNPLQPGAAGFIEILISDTSYCIFSNLIATDGFASYSWNTGDTTRMIEITDGGNYSVRGTNIEGCYSIAQFNAPDPIPPGGGDPIAITVSNPEYCYSTSLSATSGFAGYAWNTGESSQSIEIENAGTYSVIGTNSEGCTSFANYYNSGHVLPYSGEKICMVTLDEETGQNLVLIEETMNVGTDSIIIYRLNNLNSQYEQIGSLNISENGIFTDTSAIPAQQNYQYRIAVKDTCGRESNLSNTHRTILLQANVGVSNEVNLLWNPYEGFAYPNFEIYRSNESGPFNLIANVPNNNFTFTDLNPPSGANKYQVRVVKENPCVPSKSNFTYVASNIVRPGFIGIEEESKPVFTIFPNPASDKLTLKSNTLFVGTVYSISDQSGRIVLSGIIATELMEVNIISLQSGIYAISIGDRNKQSFKIIKK